MNRDLKAEKKYIFVSFALSSFCMILIMQISGYLIGGDRSLISGDLMQQYIPAIKNSLRTLLSSNKTGFYWNLSMGMNSSLFDAYYSTYNPFNLLYLFDGIIDDNCITIILIVLKTGLAAISFHYFVYRIYHVTGVMAIAFSLCYSLSAFQTTYNTVNIIWLDAMFILPMAFLGIHLLLENGNMAMLVVCYTYIFICQIYMGYVIGIGSFVYMTLMVCKGIIIEGKIKHYLIKMSKFLGASICAAGISAFVWLPALNQILMSNSLEVSMYIDNGINLADVGMQLFWGNYCTAYSIYPPIYCGLITLIMIPLYLMSGNITLTDKVVHIVTIAILIISCDNKWLYMMWHGFNYPDGWKYRFTFLICFFLCTIGAIATNEMNCKDLLKVIMTTAGLVVVCSLNYILKRSNGLIGNDTEYIQLVVNVIVIVIYCALLCSYIKYEGKRRYMEIIILALIICELTYNGRGIFISTRDVVTRILYEVWENGAHENAKLFEEDGDFYRVDSKYDLNSNSGMYSGFNGVSYFSSTENKRVKNTLGQLGVYNLPRSMKNYGLTPVTKMILGVRYDLYGLMADMILNPYEQENFHSSLVKNDNALNIGYMVAGDISDYSLTDNNAFENNNRLLSAMTGRNISVFDLIPLDEVKIKENGVILTKEDYGYKLNRIRSENSENSIAFTTPYKSSYVYIYNEDSAKYSSTDCFIMEGGEENSIYRDGDVEVSYIKEMQSDGIESELSIVSMGNVSEAYFEDMFFAKYNENELETAYKILNKNQLIVDEYSNGYIKGHVEVPDGKKMLFTSIPYSDDWMVKVDGVEQKTDSILNGAYLVIDNLKDAGMHDVELRFKACGRNEGIVISIIFSVIVGIYGIIERGKKKKGAFA